MNNNRFRLNLIRSGAGNVRQCRICSCKRKWSHSWFWFYTAEYEADDHQGGQPHQYHSSKPPNRLRMCFPMPCWIGAIVKKAKKMMKRKIRKEQKRSMDLMDKIVFRQKARFCLSRIGDLWRFSQHLGLRPTWCWTENNIQQAWWKFFVKERKDVVGIDAAILMNPKVWQASGHVANFNDAQVDCKTCKNRFRADHLIENALQGVKVEGLSIVDLDKLIEENNIKCPNCGSKDFTKTRIFNLLFQTHIGPVASDSEAVYLRGELAQSMFTNFKNVLNTSRKKIPFGIAQAGKCFRNEITPGNFIFRTLEFDLMEFEYFIHEKEWEKAFEYWLKEMHKWIEYVGIDKGKNPCPWTYPKELSHYSKRQLILSLKPRLAGKNFTGWRTARILI